MSDQGIEARIFCMSDTGKEFLGTVYRVENTGFGIVVADSTHDDYAFTFDKIEGYKGEYAEELGLRAGSAIRFVVNDGQVIKVKLQPGSFRQKIAALKFDQLFANTAKNS